MAFDLLTTNLGGDAIIDQPAGIKADSHNYIDLYTYAEKYMPELIPQLHMANGKGKITGLLRLIGAESTYASDVIEHAEQGRLHNILKDVSVDTPAGTSSSFTSPTNHQLRVNDVIKISDGTVEAQATVTAITSDTVFTAENDSGTAFGFSGNVDIMADFSNSLGKGSDPLSHGRRWEPTIYKNYTHTLMETYEVSNSDMVHKTWIMTPEGPRWYNFEMERTMTLFDNKVELTHLFFERKASGDARGMNGIIPQVEERGNIGNDYITDIDDLSEIALRAKQQGTCREFTVWYDHTQAKHIREMMAGLNASYNDGTNYGLFNNNKEMALALDFQSVTVEGVTFHFSPLALLDEPTLLGNEKFMGTSLAYFIVPSGNTYVQENGNTVTKPYLSIRYRADGNYSRKRDVRIFGPDGTPQRKDVQNVDIWSEFTNQVIGANNYFVGRRGANFYG